MLATNMTWNNEANRQAMRDVLTRKYHSGQITWDQHINRLDEILLLALPELEVLDWETSQALFTTMWPSSGIYLEPHKHRFELCQHVAECPWPHKTQYALGSDGEESLGASPCQATEHWDKRCDDCHTRWWNRIGRKENEAWRKANPPQYIHDHGPEEMALCSFQYCRNYGRVYNGHETWNGGN